MSWPVHRAVAADDEVEARVDGVVRAVGVQDEIGRRDGGDVAQQRRRPRPGQHGRGLGGDQRSPVGGVERTQPRPVVQAEHRDVDEARRRQQFGQLGRRQLPRVERVERRVAAGGERDAVGRREQQRAAGGQHPSALAQEPLLVPEVLDDLQRHHRVDHAVAHRQRDEVGPGRRHPRVAPPDVPDRLRVVVEREHLRRPACEQVGPVPLAAARLQHDAPAPRRQRLVDDQVPSEPVVLPRDPGHGALARERQLIRRHTAPSSPARRHARRKGDSPSRKSRLAVVGTETRRHGNGDSPSDRRTHPGGTDDSPGVRGGGGGAGGPGPGRRSP